MIAILEIIPETRIYNHTVLYLFPFISIVFIAILKLSFPKGVKFVVEGFINPRIFRQIIGENIARTQQVSKLLLINVFVVLLGVVSLAILQFGELNFIVWLTAAIAIIVYYVIRLVINYTTSFLSGMTDLMQESMIYNRFYLGVLGIALLPGLISLLLLPYSYGFYINGVFYKVGWIILLLGLLISYLAKVFIVLSKVMQVKVSSYYIFLYLCTLEILPLVVVFRLLIG